MVLKPIRLSGILCKLIHDGFLCRSPKGATTVFEPVPVVYFGDYLRERAELAEEIRALHSMASRELGPVEKDCDCGWCAIINKTQEILRGLESKEKEGE